MGRSYNRQGHHMNMQTRFELLHAEGSATPI
jgi:hypothetical protein